MWRGIAALRVAYLCFWSSSVFMEITWWHFEVWFHNFHPKLCCQCAQDLSFVCPLPESVFLTSSYLMSLIPYETIFPDVISIWHRLYKEKHMLAIRGVMRMLFLGNQFSSAILKNLHFHYLFEKTHKCWALAEVTFWAEQSLLMLCVTYFARCPDQKDTQQPSRLPWQRGAAYGPGVERQLCLETLRRLSP